MHGGFVSCMLSQGVVCCDVIWVVQKKGDWDEQEQLAELKLDRKECKNKPLAFCMTGAHRSESETLHMCSKQSTRLRRTMPLHTP